MNNTTTYTALKTLTLGETELVAALPGGTDEQINQAVGRVTQKRRDLATAIHVLDHLLGHPRSGEKRCVCTPEEIQLAYAEST